MKMTEEKKQSLAKKALIRRMELRRGRIGGKRGSELRERDRQVSAMGGYLIGGQAKLDKNKNNRIDAEDFKILRGEKKKPGKVMKASLGALALGLSTAQRMRKKKSAPAGLGMQGAISAKLRAMSKLMTGLKMGGPIVKAKKGVLIKPKGPGVLRMKPQDRYGQPMKPKPIKPKKKMGGGMMMRPTPMGYSKGVMVKTKIGKNKPTKMY